MESTKKFESKSQLKQDIWVLEILKNKKNGFFLDIGAFDGYNYSNTYFLEKQFNWNGICFEPNPFIFEILKKHRDCVCLQKLLHSESNIEKDFICANEISFMQNNNNKTIVDDKFKQYLLNHNVNLKTVKLKTSRIDEILNTNKIPSIIDYISCDTEGTELDILRRFPFEKYHVNTITVEHNAPFNGINYQKEIRNFLEQHNFEYVKGNDNVHNWNHGPIEDFYQNKLLII